MPVSQTAGMNANPMCPSGDMPYTIPTGLMLNQAFSPQPINYAATGNFVAQQQLLATLQCPTSNTLQT
ncbi:hypothetical protein SLEP1_g36336 [Rubroshorea leprosula]|uniref:Uncharacterized protein n=1 Tax=Rubroshorea leprosula TaxID=152421 RepID=A0AAV5KRS1_9ROSI|nr:hypothetical protein SLEP1_g36336 [Rubroshorea leprosula]